VIITLLFNHAIVELLKYYYFTALLIETGTFTN